MPSGAVITILLNLAAKFIEKNGEQYFEKIMELLWKKISPATAPKTVSAGDDDPVILEFGAACDEEIAKAA